MNFNEVNADDVLDLAASCRVEKSMMLERFLCKLFGVSSDALYEELERRKNHEKD